MGTPPVLSTEELPEAALAADGGLDVRRASQALRRRLPLMALVVALTLTVAVVLSLLQRPMYQAETTLLVVPPTSAAGGLGALAAGGVASLLGPMAPQGVPTQAALLRHPDLVSKAAAELGIEGGKDELVERVHPEPDMAASLILLKADGPTPGEAADFANRLAELHLSQTRQLGQQQAREASQFLAQELERVRSQLSGSEEELRDYKLGHDIADLTTQMQNTARMAYELSSQLTAAQVEERSAQETADYYRRETRKESDTYVASSTIARNPVVQQTEADLKKLEIERADQLAVHGANNPELKRIEAQIAQAQEALETAVGEVVQSRTEAANPRYATLMASLATAEAAARAAAARRGALEGVQGGLTAELSQWPTREVEMGRLQRDLMATSEIYVMLVKQYQQAKISEATGSPAVQIVWPAAEPLYPVTPNWPLNLLLGLVAGMALGVLAAAVAENRDDRVHNEAGLLGVVNLPIVGRAPRHALAGDGAAQEDRFRALRTQLGLVNGDTPPKLVQVTNPEAGPDASTVALGLARALAAGGRRTVLVDCHLRAEAAESRAYEAWLGDKGQCGLSDALRGQAVAECCVPTPDAGLSLLPAGAPTASPADLLDAEPGLAVLATLRDTFDAIVLDAPAAVGRPETVVLAAAADCTLLVIDTHRTHRGPLRRAVEYLAATAKPVLAFVVNRADDLTAA